MRHSVSPAYYDAAMRLLERDEPLAVLHRLRAEAAQGAGRLVFVEGEAGVGKTSLLRAFRESVPPGTEALLGSCDPLSTPRPLGPLLDVAAELDPALDRLVRDEGSSREAILGALLAALRRRDRDLVLLIDDLHWADEATLDALRFVGRRIESTRALVAGTYRDDEVGRQHPLRVVVGDLATSPAVRRLPIGGLSVGAVGVLARDSGLDPAELHRQTGGNPFYVTEVIAASPARIPTSVRDAVLARAARLSPAGRATLEAAAVIGPTVDPGLLATIVPAPAADECLSRGLLQVDGRRYAFRHELARQAILEATDPARRVALNAAVLAALEDAPVDARSSALLAHHADEAGDRAAVLRHAREAARDAVAAGAHRQAAAQLARARRYAADLPDVERGQLLEDHAREHALIARYDVALRAWDEAVTHWRATGMRAREVAALAEQSKVLVAAGRNAEAEAASQQALDLAEGLPDGPEKVEAINAQAYLRMLDRDNRQAIELGRRAIAMGGEDPRSFAAVVQALNTVGTARILLGDLAGQADVERSGAMALERGFDRLAGGAYSVLASALGEVYEFAAAQPVFEAGLRFTTERDLDASRAYLQCWLALSNLYRGRWSEVGPLATSVLANPNNSVISRTMAHLALGRLRARRGDPDVWTALDEALALASPTATLQRVGPVRAARAEAAWLEGDAQRAAAEASAAFELAVRHEHPWHTGELAWWQAASGRPPTDGELAIAAEPWRLQLAGQWRASAAAWRSVECPYEAARALLASDAVEDVQEAHAVFDQLGAGPALALAGRRLRELGVATVPRGRRPSTRANAAGLTARELEILRLVADGLANHQIATRLFVSPRTVDHHVSAILGKLGVARRTDAASAASSLGIDLQNGQDAGPE